MAGTMSDSPLPRCTVLGNGTMGAQIALSLALGGAQTVLWGRRPESLDPSLARVSDAFDFLVDAGLAKADAKPTVLARISTSSDLASAVQGAAFVIEAVAEDISIKQTILKAAEKAVAGTTMLSSTTSALSATDIQSALERPEMFCVAHYAQPAHLVRLVEIVPGARTDEATTDATTQLMADTDKTPVLCPDIPGFLWARIQHAVLREFATLVGKGLVTPEACDTILKQGYASRLPAMGAFEHADLAGLDLLNGEAAKAVWADLSNVTSPAETPVGAIHAQGNTGMRSGKGFYDWTTDRDPDEFKRQRDEEIVRRVKIQKGAKVEL
ncbi:MAG: 3-hydroxyacyl-CoA dehydrogenase family protein [Alphaproteobacteria bacterium]|nr:3-hydroxyacyl-CoA dehydrogenase family protein [Alphaproteobacteria bacterium]